MRTHYPKLFLYSFLFLLNLSYLTPPSRLLAQAAGTIGGYFNYCLENPGHKLLHVGSTFAIYTAVYQVGGRTDQAQFFAIASAMGAGAAKEAYDWSHGEPLVNGLGDIALWDAGGTLLGVVLGGSPVSAEEGMVRLTERF